MQGSLRPELHHDLVQEEQLLPSQADGIFEFPVLRARQDGDLDEFTQPMGKLVETERKIPIPMASLFELLNHELRNLFGLIQDTSAEPGTKFYRNRNSPMVV